MLRAKRQAFVSGRGSPALGSSELHSSLSNIFQNNDIIVSSYVAVGSECDVMPPLLGMIGPGQRLALPCADTKQARLVFREWRPSDALERSPLGFCQPLRTAPEVMPDVILTPLLGFDRSLARLGQGAGHYDRAFEDFPSALRIGIAWSCQEVDTIPCDPWDIPLDAVVTEREWVTGPSSRVEAAL